MSSTNVKRLDAVKLMRDIRDQQKRKYEKHPAQREKNLHRIHKKYGIAKTSKQ